MPKKIKSNKKSIESVKKHAEWMLVYQMQQKWNKYVEQATNYCNKIHLLNNDYAVSI